MNPRKMAGIALGLAVALGTGQPAEAAVTDPYLSWSGASCDPYGTANTAVSQNWNRSGGAVYNLNSSDQYVQCPAAKKDPEAIAGTTFAPIWFYNNGGTVTCTLYALDVVGDVVDSQTKSSTGSGQQAMYFDSVSSSGEWGSWEYICSLPHASGILGYMVVEQ